MKNNDTLTFVFLSHCVITGDHLSQDAICLFRMFNVFMAPFVSTVILPMAMNGLVFITGTLVSDSRVQTDSNYLSIAFICLAESVEIQIPFSLN